MTTPDNPTNNPSASSTQGDAADGKPSRHRVKAFLAILFFTAILSAFVTYMLVNIFTRKQEAKNPYLRFVEVTEDTTDPEPWGINWPRQYDDYKKTVEVSKTNFGGGDAAPAEKANEFPFLTRMFAGYAFAIDYRDRRGHAWMLYDQENTKRVTDWKAGQPWACLQCHASVIPT